MSDKEKDLIDQIAKLPPEVQDKFLIMAQASAITVDTLRAAEARDEGSGDDDA